MSWADLSPGLLLPSSPQEAAQAAACAPAGRKYAPNTLCAYFVFLFGKLEIFNSEQREC